MNHSCSVYREDMPRALPIVDLFVGMARRSLEYIRHWMHLAFVSMMWLFFVPTCICKSIHITLICEMIVPLDKIQS